MEQKCEDCGEVIKPGDLSKCPSFTLCKECWVQRRVKTAMTVEIKMAEDFDKLVAQERWRQDAKWGVQNHHPEKWTVILMEEVGELSKEILEDHATFEDELIQVAAVAKAMWESGRRNGWI